MTCDSELVMFPRHQLRDGMDETGGRGRVGGGVFEVPGVGNRGHHVPTKTGTTFHLYIIRSDR